MSWLITGTEKTPVDQLGIHNVSLLLHGDGTNGSTTITDSSPTPKTVTAVGNAQISTAQSKFGGSSLLFDGSGDYLTTSASERLDFGTQDFTIELWHRFSDISADRAFIGNDTPTRIDFLWRTGTGINVGRINIAFDSTFAWSPTVNVWYHIAISRSGSSLRAFVDGSQIGSTATNTNNYSASGCLIGASTAAARFCNGYIDDLRITKGIARYTANFTPPTASFPDI
jgi:hypothetical protein